MSFVEKQRDEEKTERALGEVDSQRERERQTREKKEKSIGDPGNLWVCPSVCTGDIAAAAHRRDQWASYCSSVILNYP